MGHELPRRLAERAAIMPPKAAAPSRDQGGRGGPLHKVAALQPAARGQCTRSTKSLRDSEASGLSESTFASAKDLNDEPGNRRRGNRLDGQFKTVSVGHR